MRFEANHGLGREAYEAPIRAEIDGGGDLLDALKLAERAHGLLEDPELAVIGTDAVYALMRLRSRIAEEIRKRYQLQYAPSPFG